MAETTNQSTGEGENTGPNRRLGVVECFNPHNPNKIVRINESTFEAQKDPEYTGQRYVLVDNGKKPRTPEEMALMELAEKRFREFQESRPLNPADGRDEEILRLRAELKAAKEAREKAEQAAWEASVARKPAEKPAELPAEPKPRGRPPANKVAPAEPAEKLAEPAADSLAGLAEI